MKVWIGITDRDWFNHLSSGEAPEEVNFWQPSGNVPFRALQVGEPFLFKLHSPDNFIVGGGFFSHYTVLPVSFAWSAFETKNGATTEHEMRLRIERYRREGALPAEDYKIGCVLLQAPFFLERADWIPVPFWKSGIQRGWGLETEAEPAKSLWAHVEALIKGKHVQPLAETIIEQQGARYGKPLVTLPRLGQGTFRVCVTDAYGRRCAFTQEKALPVLEAAHIHPYSKDGEHSVTNGVLLRSDLHRLFDAGYMTIDPESRTVVVSRRLREEFDNGREYYPLHGRKPAFPTDVRCVPSAENLRYHAEKIFR